MTNEQLWKEIHATPCHAAGLKRRLELLAMLDPGQEPAPRKRRAPRRRKKAQKPKRVQRIRTPRERRERALWVALRREGLIIIHANISRHHVLLIEPRTPYYFPNKKNKRSKQNANQNR